MSHAKRTGALAQYGKAAAESEVAFATPHRLIQMLLEGALDKVNTARGQLERKDYEGKSRHISWAISIINGLKTSLDMEAGGGIAVNLDDLYAYMNRRLIDANTSNNIDALNEVADLLKEIKAGWDAMPDEVKSASGKEANLAQMASGAI